MPIKKVGSDIPKSENPITASAPRVLRASAAYAPKGMPITVASTTATVANSTVAGRRAAKRSATGAACLKDSPKSPRQAFVKNRQNCTQPESFNPSAAASLARSLGVASSGSICATGSPTN